MPRTDGKTRYYHYECKGPAFPLYFNDGQHSKPIRLRGAFFCPACDKMVRVPNVVPESQMKRLAGL